VGLRTPIPEAEKIKREHAWAWRELLREDCAVDISSVGNRPPRTIFARMLCEIVEPRAQELLALVLDELKRAALERQIPAGLVLTGGGARLSGLAELAERMSSLPVRVAAPRGLEGMTEEVSQPGYATAVGLLLYGARQRRLAAQRPSSFSAKLKTLFAGA
jgi:cell division protein FtsA